MRNHAPALAGAAAALAATAAFALPPQPSPDVHFLGPRGNIQRGVRCATPTPTRAEARAVEHQLKSLRAIYGEARPGGNVVIPVVFHVIHDGAAGNVLEAMLDDQIDVLNDAFRSSGFEFFKSQVNRVDNRRWFTGCYAQDTRMKRALAVDPAHNLNFYTCQPRGNILGYAYLPWSFDETDERHGVVVLHSSLPGGSAVPYNLGDTGTHEVGHYLGLLHTFDNGCQAPGDSVDDTPFEASPAFGCPTGRDTCAQPGLDPIQNFMDYTDDACMFEFSGGQDTRMDDIVATYKPSLGN
jgi:hypothetical protein